MTMRTRHDESSPTRRRVLHTGRGGKCSDNNEDGPPPFQMGLGNGRGPPEREVQTTTLYNRVNLEEVPEAGEDWARN